MNNPTEKWAEDLNRPFSKEETHIVNRHMKRCSTSPITRKIQIKTTIRYHLTLVRMVIIKKFTNNKSWDFPSGPVVKNPPANAGDTSLIPGPGRFHMQWDN